MSINLNKNKDSLLAAWKDVLDDKTPTNWALFGYEGLSNDLKLVSKGANGIDEMIEDLNSGKIMYAFLRVIDPKTSLPKCVLVNWQGEGAPNVRKGTCANHVRDISNFFKGAHVTLNARNEEEVDPTLIIDKVSKSTGSVYKFTERGEYSNDSGPVGTAYKRTIPKQEINAVERDKFWERQEAEERQRQEAERQKRAEETKRLEEERRKRDSEETAQRETKIRETTKSIEQIRLAEKVSFDEVSVLRWPGLDLEIVKSCMSLPNSCKYYATALSSLVKVFRDIKKGLSAGSYLRGLSQKKHKRAQAANSQQVEDLEKEELERRNRAEVLRRQRSEEAQALISKRTIDARAIFERNTAAGQLVQRRSSVQPRETTELSAAQRRSSEIPASIQRLEKTQTEVPQTYPVKADIENPSPPVGNGINGDSNHKVLDEDPQGWEDEVKHEIPVTHTPTIGNVAAAEEHLLLPPEQFINGDFGLTARALYDYQAADETEITFDPGDVITHIDQIDEGWWQGLGPDGTYGLFPANYVELLK